MIMPSVHGDTHLMELYCVRLDEPQFRSKTNPMVQSSSKSLKRVERMAKKSKQAREEEQQILNNYHKWLTEQALEPLYQDFVKWKQGMLPYDELTEHIHHFHKRNQEIWKDFNYTERDDLVLYAKMRLGKLTTSDIEQHGSLLDSWRVTDDSGDLDTK